MDERCGASEITRLLILLDLDKRIDIGEETLVNSQSQIVGHVDALEEYILFEHQDLQVHVVVICVIRIVLPSQKCKT